MLKMQDIAFSYDSREDPKLKIDSDILYFAYNRGSSINGLAQAKEKHPITWWQAKIGHPDAVIRPMQVNNLQTEISYRMMDDDSQFFEAGEPNYKDIIKPSLVQRFLDKKGLSSTSQEGQLLEEYQEFLTINQT